VFAAGCGSETNQTNTKKPIPVRITPVVERLLSIPIHTSGVLAPAAEAKLSFKIGGVVESVAVDEGASVQKSELLAGLKLDEIQAQVNQARSAFEKAERDLRRARRLLADSVATVEQVQNAETALTVARSNLEIAEFNLSHSEIVAPTAGKILRRFVEPNELVAPGVPVFLFGSTTADWIVRVGVTDRDIVRIALGDTARVAFDAHPGEVFGGRVSEIAETADPLNGTYEVELVVQQDHRRLVSGFVAAVDIYPGKKERYFVVPIEALVEANGAEGIVYAPADDGKQVLRVPIIIAHVFEDQIAVATGLERASNVITSGTLYLSDDSLIRIVN
jgi:RND family efflux transporter MFP subunit